VDKIAYGHFGNTVGDICPTDILICVLKFITDFQNTQGIIYVVDSADTDRVEESRQRLNEVLSSDELVGVPVLVLANKQDLPAALNAYELSQKLGLNTLRGREWHIQGTCAGNGEGLYEGLDWLGTEVRK
jgi:signal recognition particle receptor subunit beta